MEALILEPSLYTVKAILILDNDGDRLFAKYYDDTYPSVKEQKAFEKNIFNKTHRTDSEIALLEGLTVVYKSSIDLYFYVIGSSYENELMLMAVLNCLFDSLSQMLRKNVEKRALLENMEGLFLAVDEIVDGGVILESDPQQVVHRVALRVSRTVSPLHPPSTHPPGPDLLNDLRVGACRIHTCGILSPSLSNSHCLKEGKQEEYISAPHLVPSISYSLHRVDI
ncbi:coatomer subunit zeta-1 isoform X1 [Monodon monoceros]|uniref:coatomer subunit zeta-1 isoform X1 n=1 Tax=Monodon monoceros TaxID=40151 RepID=UPI0010F59011|nr:coatomer subunit zeta-1 isoform X1 [Monodon monoceros]